MLAIFLQHVRAACNPRRRFSLGLLMGLWAHRVRAQEMRQEGQDNGVEEALCGGKD